MKVGFIGLGVMGRHMAGHLLRGGHTLGVYARRADSAASLVKAGATHYATPAALAAASDVVFTIVTASSDFEQVALGADGLIHGAKPGSVVVDMETISPAVALTSRPITAFSASPAVPLAASATALSITKTFSSSCGTDAR